MAMERWITVVGTFVVVACARPEPTEVLDGFKPPNPIGVEETRSGTSGGVGPTASDSLDDATAPKWAWPHLVKVKLNPKSKTPPI